MGDHGVLDGELVQPELVGQRRELASVRPVEPDPRDRAVVRGELGVRVGQRRRRADPLARDVDGAVDHAAPLVLRLSPQVLRIDRVGGEHEQSQSRRRGPCPGARGSSRPCDAMSRWIPAFGEQRVTSPGERGAARPGPSQGVSLVLTLRLRRDTHSRSHFRAVASATVTHLDGIYRHQGTAMVWDVVGVSLARPGVERVTHAPWSEVVGTRRIGTSPGRRAPGAWSHPGRRHRDRRERRPTRGWRPRAFCRAAYISGVQLPRGSTVKRPDFPSPHSVSG